MIIRRNTIKGSQVSSISKRDDKLQRRLTQHMNLIEDIKSNMKILNLDPGMVVDRIVETKDLIRQSLAAEKGENLEELIIK